MGVVTSVLMGRGSPTTQMVSLVTDTLYNSFVEKDTATFEEFHVEMLDIFSAFNSALPGKHYNVPSRQEVEACFAEWTKASASERKQVFINFIKSVSLNKIDNTTLITGLVTPPAAMAVKKTGESVPALKIMKAVPDVLFVPTVTIVALITAQLSRKAASRRKMVKQDEQEG